jgi:hypothetical protein
MPNAPGFPASYKNVAFLNACEDFDVPSMAGNIYRGHSNHPALDRKEHEKGWKTCKLVTIRLKLFSPTNTHFIEHIKC